MMAGFERTSGWITSSVASTIRPLSTETAGWQAVFLCFLRSASDSCHLDADRTHNSKHLMAKTYIGCA